MDAPSPVARDPMEAAMESYNRGMARLKIPLEKIRQIYDNEAAKKIQFGYAGDDPQKDSVQNLIPVVLPIDGIYGGAFTAELEAKLQFTRHEFQNMQKSAIILVSDARLHENILLCKVNREDKEMPKISWAARHH